MKLFFSIAKESASSQAQQDVANAMYDSYKRSFIENTIPYSALTMGKVIGQGTLMIELLFFVDLACNSLTGAFGKVFEGELRSSDDSQTAVAIKTIKGKATL